MDIPSTLQVGDYWEWEDTLDDYDADLGWTLTYYFQLDATNSFSIAAAGDGTTHTTTLAAATSAAKTAGYWKWTARVANEDSQPKVYTIDSGFVTLEPDPSVARDVRSWARKAYDELTAIIEGRAAREASSLAVAGRQVAYMSWPEIEQAHAFLKAQIRVEEQGSNGGLGRDIRVRYGRP